jgi:hypothetical protein
MWLAAKPPQVGSSADFPRQQLLLPKPTAPDCADDALCNIPNFQTKKKFNFPFSKF